MTASIVERSLVDDGTHTEVVRMIGRNIAEVTRLKSGVTKIGGTRVSQVKCVSPDGVILPALH